MSVQGIELKETCGAPCPTPICTLSHRNTFNKETQSSLSFNSVCFDLRLLPACFYWEHITFGMFFFGNLYELIQLYTFFYNLFHVFYMLSLTFSYDIIYISHLFIYTDVKFPIHHNSFTQSSADREIISFLAWAVMVLPGSFWSIPPHLHFFLGRTKRSMLL